MKVGITGRWSTAWGMNLLFIGAALSLGLGLFWPLITVEKSVKVWFISLVDESNTVSLASGLQGLFVDGHFFLFLILFLFSVFFPVAKLSLCAALWYTRWPLKKQERTVHLLAATSKWSMLDVLAGLLVVILKLGSLVSVSVHLGVVFFAVSVILSMILTTVLNRQTFEVAP